MCSMVFVAVYYLIQSHTIQSVFMNGLGFLNIELSSRCNKKCAMCGRRKLEREYPSLVDWGDMEFDVVKQIAREVPKGITVQFHSNGESLLHPRFGDCISLFRNNIRCLDTNGKLILEKFDEVCLLETLTISVVQDDPEGDEQHETVTKFLSLKGDRPPNMVYRLLGKVDDDPWSRLPGIVARRILHSPDGSFNYQKNPTIPEIGICLDLLTHLAIDRYGNASACVRFDPEGHLKLGNIKERTLYSMWTGLKRKTYIQKHIEGKRHELPGCKSCEYWGVPRGE